MGAQQFNFVKLIFSIWFILIVQTTVILGKDDHQSKGPVVEVAQGKLRGTTLKSRDGRDYSAFYKVPYGTAERFENPKRVGNWEGIYDATKIGEPCAQSQWITNDIAGVEDCLHINIYTPNLNGNYPVMFYIHGGGFKVGSGNNYRGRYFMDEDVVLVTVNYRLGPLGFLSTGEDGVIPGNFGLKDQNMALQFVAENIRKFGGDPSHVTIFGGSAGGASVNYHLLSPLSKGLFSSAISQSGTSLNLWGYTIDPLFMRTKYTKIVNCPLESNALLACLRNKTTYELMDAVKQTVVWGYDPPTPFHPVVESKDLKEGTAFLQERPEILLETGKFNKVNWIIGIDEDEGILMHGGWILDSVERTADLRKNWKKIFPVTLKYDTHHGKFSQERQDQASELIHEYYFNNDKIIGGSDYESRQALYDLYGDRHFHQGIKRASLLAARHTPVYAYLYSFHRKDWSIMDFLGVKRGSFGVTHHDEHSLLFSELYGLAPEFREGSLGEKMSRRLVKLWVSIARNNKPTSLWGNEKSWEPMSPAEISGEKPIQFFVLNNDTAIREEFFTDRVQFWDNLEKTVLVEGATGRAKDEL